MPGIRYVGVKEFWNVVRNVVLTHVRGRGLISEHDLMCVCVWLNIRVRESSGTLCM